MFNYMTEWSGDRFLFFCGQEKKAMEKIHQVKTREKHLLLQNIQQLEDAPEGEEEEEGGSLHNLPLSPDGKYLVLTAADESEDAFQSGDLAQPMENLTVEPLKQTISDSCDTEDVEPESEAWWPHYAIDSNER